ncbi:MAG: cytochrome c oxidase accessory protein CcoG [Cyanobacteria bacterium RYN_339]|nr:cytochrome c oxidase accessory protein CcoG [Cyanobacteria bacterium RYN_339]
MSTAAKLHFLTGRPRVQTQWVFGPRERLRWSIFALKLAVFLVLPWSGAVWFDVPHRRYHLFGQVFWPQDFYLLGLFLAIAAVMLFFSTALAARSWCGFACPQTLLTHLFMLIDHGVEGDRPARLALDHGQGRWLRRVLKHGLWLLVSAGLGLTFARYFVGPGAWGAEALALAGFITGVTYVFAGHLRDWVCTTVCPYGRFQGAMQDADSLLVTYDAVRGEPRAKGLAAIARGACVDCNQCVTACPMGIDIRQGSQYECISCQRCVDACNDTMGRIGAAPDLIRMASLREQEARAATGAWPGRGARHWLRPRVLWYAAVLVVLVGLLAGLTVNRPLLAIASTRDANRVYALPGGRTSDFYRLALLNKDTRVHAVRVELRGLAGQLVGAENEVTLAAGEITTLNASVVAPAAAGEPRPFAFVLRDVATGAEVGLALATLVTR